VWRKRFTVRLGAFTVGVELAGVLGPEGLRTVVLELLDDVGSAGGRGGGGRDAVKGLAAQYK